MRPYLSDLHLTIIQGDDHVAVVGRAFSFEGYGVSWPTQAPDAVYFRLYEPQLACALQSDLVLEIPGQINWAAVPKVLAFDVPRDLSAGLETGNRRYAFDVRGVFDVDGEVVTLARGLVSVLGSNGGL